MPQRVAADACPEGTGRVLMPPPPLPEASSLGEEGSWACVGTIVAIPSLSIPETATATLGAQTKGRKLAQVPP